MKKNVLFLLGLVAIFITLFTSCSSNDDNKESGKASIVGTWAHNEGHNLDYVLVFKADNTGYYYILENKKDVLSISKTTWKLDGTKLVIKSAGKPDKEYEISLTKSSFILKNEYDGLLFNRVADSLVLDIEKMMKELDTLSK